VHLLSDGAAPGLKELQNKGLRLVYHQIGQSANNAGIVGLDVRANPENPLQRAIFASVANFGPNELRTELELSFNGQLLESKPLTVPSTNTTPLVFFAAQQADGVFSVRLTAKDDMPADNEAAIVSLLPQPVKVLLVTRGNAFLQKALKAAGRVELSVARDLADPKPPFDLVVLDAVTPTAWPAVNVLAFQTMNAGWFEGVGNMDTPAIVDWKATHPLLRFVTFDNVAIAKTASVKTPAWAVAVVESPQTPLVLAGELARQRIVWVGFDVLDSNWPMRISFPIFVANAVEWLNPASIQAGQLLVPAGNPFRLALEGSTTSAEVRLPDAVTRKLELDPKASELMFGDTARRGVYQLTAGTNTTTFCVNLLDAAETDTHPRSELDFGRFGTVSATTTKRANLELWRWIAAAALTVLLFEWWYYHRRTA
jgi:Ca-activated chloride channel homolog